MADYSYSSEVFLSELMRISSTLIWKNPQIALANESNVDSIDVEQYILAVQGKLTFELVYKFEEDVLLSTGIPEESVSYYSDNPMDIPEQYRAIATRRQTEYILNNYEEYNNYYRMLNGLPDVGDETFFYNTEYPDISDSVTPIHLLDTAQAYLLEENGYLGKLIEANPTKKYLDHLTDKKVDIYNARMSEAFALLWVDDSKYTTMVSEFRETYNLCRNMVNNIYYSKTLQNQNSEYCGFIGMTILFATINHMHYKFLDTDTTREFYDEDSLRLVYDSYGVPFYSQIPMEYHKEIVKNMNILMSHKGSTNVFYDLFDIFGLSDMSVFEFYMMKVHRFENGKPVFIKDADGNYDYKKMYDIKFAKITLYNDPVSEMLDSKNYLPYEDLTENDPYWIDDENLQNKIYNEEYNYMESKYMGINTTFNLMKIVYESCYYLKMIIDNRNYLTTTNVYNSTINMYCNLFDLVVYVCAIICQKYGFEGNIPSDPHEIGKVMGFNFKDDLNILKQNISENDYLKNDPQLLSYLESMTVTSLDSIKRVYTKLTELRSYLCNKMADTDIPGVYMAYYELYNSIMYSEYVDDVFLKSDGTPAESFADMLNDINQTLYARLESEGVDKDNELSDILYLLQSSCDQLENIQFADNINMDSLIECLFKLADFFKSAKVDLTGYELVYSLVLRSENVMKLMNMINYIHNYFGYEPQYSILDDLMDIMANSHDLAKMENSIIQWGDWYDGGKNFWKLQSIIDKFDDYIKTVSCVIRDLSDAIPLHDYVTDVNLTKLEENFEFGDSVALLYDEVMEVIKYIIIDNFNVTDALKYMLDVTYTKDEKEDKLQFLTTLSILIREKISDSIKHEDYIKKEKFNYGPVFNITFTDALKTKLINKLDDSVLNIEDIITYIIETSRDSNMKSDSKLDDEINNITSIDLLSPDNIISFADEIVSEILASILESDIHMEDIIKSISDLPDILSDNHHYSDILNNDRSRKILAVDGSFGDYLILRREVVEE